MVASSYTSPRLSLLCFLRFHSAWEFKSGEVKITPFHRFLETSSATEKKRWMVLCAGDCNLIHISISKRRQLHTQTRTKVEEHMFNSNELLSSLWFIGLRVETAKIGSIWWKMSPIAMWFHLSFILICICYSFHCFAVAGDFFRWFSLWVFPAHMLMINRVR